MSKNIPPSTAVSELAAAKRRVRELIGTWRDGYIPKRDIETILAASGDSQ
ncbi:hypothetical protein GCM10011404_04780 [Sphingomonas prati]|uniref:Uncharacterized protein n=1 Tax=Sphingomonas prati TaxID=1843237 RepID=A0A7W9F0E1_9SPHN|nr:hypothetical protein [Sphingomonas prati]GGE75240.1 hypothetical protein GCM10011404_04780 [Sphingomonas prati]